MYNTICNIVKELCEVGATLGMLILYLDLTYLCSIAVYAHLFLFIFIFNLDKENLDRSDVSISLGFDSPIAKPVYQTEVSYKCVPKSATALRK